MLSVKKKLRILSACSFALALGIFFFAYYLYHYLSPTCTFTTVWSETPNKPMIALLFAIWGVLFLFSGVMSLLVERVFFSEKSEDIYAEP